jgi:hypothetical protein
MRSRRRRGGIFEPMGEKAHTDLILDLYRRASIPEGYKPYDLRDTFATLAYRASGKNWDFVEKLLRHASHGQGIAYIEVEGLCEDLERLSPFRVLNLFPPTPLSTRTGSQKMNLVETGESPGHDTQHDYA